MTKLGIDFPMYDILQSSNHKQDLKAGGGNTTVPCLKIVEEGKTRWLYESGDIVRYLQQKFASQ